MGKKPRNADYTKEYNQKEILRILRHGSMSRVELAKTTGLSRAACSLITEELLNQGLLSELEPRSMGRGRKVTPLKFHADSYYALAVNLARKGCEVALCDMAGKVYNCQKIPDQNNMVLAITRQLQLLAQTVDRAKILGIGISSPGPLDCEQGRILNPPHFERWQGVEIGRQLSEALELPAYLEHDVCAMAMHQLEMGQSRNFMLVFVDIGIGAAIMSDGQLLGNSHNFTGELGHTTIRFDGRLCACGNRGCLETYASIPALLEGSGYRDWMDLIDHVDQEVNAKKLLNQEGIYLSAGLINLLNLTPVDTIYLAGDLCYRYQLLAQQLQREIGEKSLRRSNQDVQIFPAAQGSSMGVLSAAEVVFSRFFVV